MRVGLFLHIFPLLIVRVANITVAVSNPAGVSGARDFLCPIAQESTLASNTGILLVAHPRNMSVVDNDFPGI
jgi:hypothetical protein